MNSLTDKHKYEGEIILEWLRELGYIWVGKFSQVCAESPEQKMKRFNLYQGHWEQYYRFAISIWYGTSHHVPCEDMTWLTEDDPYYEENNSDDKVLSITVTIGLEPIPNPNASPPYFSRYEFIKSIKLPKEYILFYHIVIHDKSEVVLKHNDKTYSAKYFDLKGIEGEIPRVRKYLMGIL